MLREGQGEGGSARTPSGHHLSLGSKAVARLHFWQSNDVGKHNPKTDVVVEVVWVVPVAVRAAGVPMIIVERTAAQHAILRMGPSQRALRPARDCL
jgi:hypothetical protein